MNQIKFLAVLILFSATCFAQSPQALNYQAVVRDKAGEVLSNSSVTFRFTIRDLTTDGKPVFTETQTMSTNQFGLVNLKIGSEKNLENVNWADGAKFLQIEIDAKNSGSFTDMGTQQMMSVPYALYALHAGKADVITNQTSHILKTTNGNGNGSLTWNCSTHTLSLGANSVILANCDGTFGGAGATGAKGCTGAQGIQGVQGPTGATGAKGNTGANGTNGLNGATGAQGIQGVPGNNGAVGPTGAQGIQGVPGNIGSTGATGATGANGNNGTNGLNGSTGAQGIQGIPGNDGAKGATGENGIQGVPGNDGATGPTGADGIQGVPGNDGATGPTGADGLQGIPGNDGATGASGATGADGIQGVPGNDGATGADGIQGVPGNDGATGATGANGIQGIPGNDGATGPTGLQGVAGNNGATGATGAQGLTGPTGFISNGTAAGNTTFWNGTQWVANNSNIYNNGGNVGIGNAAPHSSAILDLSNSSNKGFMLPQATTAVHPASPKEGLMVFNTTTGCIEYFVDNSWQPIACKCSSPPAQPGAITGINFQYCYNTPYNFYVGTVNGASSYIWSVTPSVPYTITGQGTSSAQISFTSGLATSVNVQAMNSCGTSTSQTFPVSRLTLSNPGIPVQNPGGVVCIGDTVTYSCNVVPNAINYVWIVSSGNVLVLNNSTTITTTGTSVAVRWNNVTAKIKVRAVGCSSILGPEDSLNANVLPKPNIPAIPVKSKPLCPFDTVTFTTNVVANASTYQWSLPSGWTSISGSTITTANYIKVNVGPYSNSATGLQVRARNCSGVSNYSGSSGPDQVGGHGSMTFNPGLGQVFYFPKCFDTIQVDVSGGGGGSAFVKSPSLGNLALANPVGYGKGSRIQATLVFINKPDSIYVNVGSKGQNATATAAGLGGGGGAQGSGGDAKGGPGALGNTTNHIFGVAGGGGGGESDIRLGPINANGQYRILAAGGGGGAGVKTITVDSVIGLWGGNGATSATNYDATGGQSYTGCGGGGIGGISGANGAAGGAGSDSCLPVYCQVAASAGNLSIGGTGGTNTSDNTCMTPSAGGGGGGGRFGGGGGMNAGGGGGSTKVGSTVTFGSVSCTVLNPTVTPDYQAGSGVITISW